MRLFRTIFPAPWPLLGVVHLAPLPGSPRHELSMKEIAGRAEADAEALAAAGFDGVLVENFGDQPFHPDEVEPHTVSAMALLVARVLTVVRRTRPDGPPPVGVNVLRNDARAAIAIAATTGARFVRVNVHTGAMVTDQGLLQGKAHETLRYRRALGAEVAILADVLVKHAQPLAPAPVEALARDTFLRGGADALIVTGFATGEPADLGRAARVRDAVDAPVLLGSGFTSLNLPEARRVADGAIVGTWLKQRGEITNAVDQERARALVERRDALVASTEGAG